MKRRTKAAGAEVHSLRSADVVRNVPLSRRRFLGGAAAAWATVSILPGRILDAHGQASPGKQVTIGFIGVGEEAARIRVPVC